jgi:choline dehydrogenase-like flavoprotein
MVSNNSDASSWEISHPEEKTWDVVVIGTGMGGSTVGYALANRGIEVLFVEKGELIHKQFQGDDRHAGADVPDGTPTSGRSPGQWPARLAIRTNLGDAHIDAPLACGSGGTTTCYGGVLERMVPIDFQPAACFPNIPGTTLPEIWPVGFDELRPHYEMAERLFRVRGTPDPLYEQASNSLLAPPELDAKDKALFSHLKKRGLNPYRLHLASEFHPACEYCPGYCAKECRNDAAKICLLPALKTGRAKFIGSCDVQKIEADSTAVKSVVFQRRNATHRVRGRIVVLAAGAYGSPLILLNSVSKDWPAGLANQSGLVGRNLMMHTTDFFAIWPEGMGTRDGYSRTVALKDLYFDGGIKLGMIQSSGVKGNWGLVLQFLRDYVDKSGSWWKRLFRPFLPIAAWLGVFVFNRSVIMATIIEDLPYKENRVVPDADSPGGFRVEYEYKDELKSRNARMREKIKERFGKYRVAFLLERKNNLNFGHPCGTCRFGEDPSLSVLDRNNKAHGIDNLYVVDGSFFPSSAGVNPSLTIAANSLRVANVIAERLSNSH